MMLWRHSVGRFCKYLALSGVAALLLVTTTGCMTSAVTHPSRSQAQRFVAALASHQFSIAEGMVDPSQRSQFSARYLQTRWKQLEGVIGKPTTIVLDDVEISANFTIGKGSASTRGPSKSARYTYSLTGATKREAQVAVTLIELQGKWWVERVIFAF